MTKRGKNNVGNLSWTENLVPVQEIHAFPCVKRNLFDVRFFDGANVPVFRVLIIRIAYVSNEETDNYRRTDSIVVIYTLSWAAGRRSFLLVRKKQTDENCRSLDE